MHLRIDDGGASAMRNALAPERFVEVLAPALRQAASIARALEGRVTNRPKPGEITDVKAALTIADTASQEALLVPLHARFPGVRVEAEEDTPSVHLFSPDGDPLVVIDPIDGTLRFYLEGRGPYAVLIGLAVGDVYQASLVALPREDLYLRAVRGAGAHLARGERPARRARAAATGKRVLVSHDLPEASRALLRSHGLEPEPASGGAISVAPLLPGVCGGLRFVRKAGGSVSVRGRIGAMLAAEAGALVCGAEGQPFPESIRAPARSLLVAPDADILEMLVEAVRAAC
jgi:fructose-1,6-bisphosphatase/inositol monophosphatase family enzyme